MLATTGYHRLLLTQFQRRGGPGARLASWPLGRCTSPRWLALCTRFGRQRWLSPATTSPQPPAALRRRPEGTQLEQAGIASRARLPAGLAGRATPWVGPPPLRAAGVPPRTVCVPTFGPALRHWESEWPPRECVGADSSVQPIGASSRIVAKPHLFTHNQNMRLNNDGGQPGGYGWAFVQSFERGQARGVALKHHCAGWSQLFHTRLAPICTWTCITLVARGDRQGGCLLSASAGTLSSSPPATCQDTSSQGSPTPDPAGPPRHKCCRASGACLDGTKGERKRSLALPPWSWPRAGLAMVRGRVISRPPSPPWGVQADSLWPSEARSESRRR